MADKMPVFKTRSEQMDWYLPRFLDWVISEVPQERKEFADKLRLVHNVPLSAVVQLVRDYMSGLPKPVPQLEVGMLIDSIMMTATANIPKPLLVPYEADIRDLANRLLKNPLTRKKLDNLYKCSPLNK